MLASQAHTESGELQCGTLLPVQVISSITYRLHRAGRGVCVEVTPVPYCTHPLPQLCNAGGPGTSTFRADSMTPLLAGRVIGTRPLPPRDSLPCFLFLPCTLLFLSHQDWASHSAPLWMDRGEEPADPGDRHL